MRNEKLSVCSLIVKEAASLSQVTGVGGAIAVTAVTDMWCGLTARFFRKVGGGLTCGRRTLKPTETFFPPHVSPLTPPRDRSPPAPFFFQD